MWNFSGLRVMLRGYRVAVLDIFREPYPASTAFIAPLLNPDWLVEVEAVAVVD
jgi:enamine deaminase RidA (YjgF/YER057c/UK114 family)